MKAYYLISGFLCLALFCLASTCAFASSVSLETVPLTAETVTKTALVLGGLAELFLRVVPTTKNRSIIQKLIKILDVLVPNKAISPTGEKRGVHASFVIAKYPGAKKV